MQHARNMAIEGLRALAVLALAFLSFAHTPVALASSGPDTLAAALDMSYCGDLPDTPRAHAPCHACRIGGSADLVPPCTIAIPAVVLTDVAWGAMPSLSLPATPLHSFDARGPPYA